MPAWCDEITPPSSGVEPNGVGNGLMVKSQIRPATLLMIANRAMKPAMCTRIEACPSGRNSTRSIAMPAPNERTTESMNAPQ